MKFQININFDSKSGQFHVDGPFEDSVLFLGMLEMAKVTLIDVREKEGKAAKVAPMIAIPRLPNQ